MGGTGSGRWAYHDKKTTAEECWAIGVSEVVGIVEPSKPGAASASLRPARPKSGRRMPPVRCVLERDAGGDVLLKLSYVLENGWGIERRAEQVVPLRATRANFGGARWWFSCPRRADGGECGRRVGKLYRPPDGRRFACRHCLRLTYESCQRSHRYDRLSALVTGEASGETFDAVKLAFSDATKGARHRRAAPSPKLSDVFRTMLN